MFMGMSHSVRHSRTRDACTSYVYTHCELAILTGVGTDQNDWRDPDLPGDASINIDWYIENARGRIFSMTALPIFVVATSRSYSD